jgi:hypothetical protein
MTARPNEGVPRDGRPEEAKDLPGARIDRSIRAEQRLLGAALEVECRYRVGRARQHRERLADHGRTRRASCERRGEGRAEQGHHDDRRAHRV